jgi:hypothetical protein
MCLMMGGILEKVSISADRPHVLRVASQITHEEVPQSAAFFIVRFCLQIAPIPYSPPRAARVWVSLSGTVTTLQTFTASSCSRPSPSASHLP